MQQEPFSLEAAIIAVTIIFLVLGAFIVMIMIAFRKRRNLHIIEKISLESAFRQELLKTQIEVQEQTLGHVSREIHDNITQVLSFVKLNPALIGKDDEKGKSERITESRELIAQVINDLRDLSKSLSFEHIKKLGLLKTIESEVRKLNKSGLIALSLVVEGKDYILGGQRELVLYRILQEAVNNTLKHSGAKHLKIVLQYTPELFTLTLEDDGDGFAMGSLDNVNGSGLKNIENRAALVGAAASIDSSPGKGCRIKICLNPLEQQLYVDGNHPYRAG